MVELTDNETKNHLCTEPHLLYFTFFLPDQLLASLFVVWGVSSHPTSGRDACAGTATRVRIYIPNRGRTAIPSNQTNQGTHLQEGYLDE